MKSVFYLTGSWGMSCVVGYLMQYEPLPLWILFPTTIFAVAIAMGLFAFGMALIGED